MLSVLLGLTLALPGSSADTLELRRVAVDGSIVEAVCTAGPVEVLLLPDVGHGWESWHPVLERLDGEVGACAWRRSPAAAERGWFEFLGDLTATAEALRVAGRDSWGGSVPAGGPPEAAPVWAGEGAGGLYARMVAQDRPTAVGGLVLVDPETEGWSSTLRRGMPPEAWVAERERLAEANADGVRLDALLRRAGASAGPETPLTVLTALGVVERPGWTARWVREARRRRHSDLAEGGVPGRHLPVAGATSVLRRAPDTVADEILRVVRLRERTARRDMRVPVTIHEE